MELRLIRVALEGPGPVGHTCFGTNWSGRFQTFSSVLVKQPGSHLQLYFIVLKISCDLGVMLSQDTPSPTFIEHLLCVRHQARGRGCSALPVRAPCAEADWEALRGEPLVAQHDEGLQDQWLSVLEQFLWTGVYRHRPSSLQQPTGYIISRF